MVRVRVRVGVRVRDLHVVAEGGGLFKGPLTDANQLTEDVQ